MTDGIVRAATTPIIASVIKTSAKVKAFKLLDAPPPEIKVIFVHKFYTFLNYRI